MNIDKIISTGDPLLWKTICLADGEIPIGRASAKHADRAAKKSNMFFDNSHLSKTHAKLSITNKVLYLEDLCSTFGTVWNNNLLVPNKKVAVKEGDRIGFVLNRPSSSIKEMIKKSSGAAMIPMDTLLNPLVQLVFSVISFDEEEGSLVLLPLKGLDYLLDLRTENLAKKALLHSDTDPWGEESETKLQGVVIVVGNQSTIEVSDGEVDSDGPPLEESFEREFSRQVAPGGNSEVNQPSLVIKGARLAESDAVKCEAPQRIPSDVLMFNSKLEISSESHSSDSEEDLNPLCEICGANDEIVNSENETDRSTGLDEVQSSENIDHQDNGGSCKALNVDENSDSEEEPEKVIADGDCWGCEKDNTQDNTFLPFGLLEYDSDAKASNATVSNDEDYVSNYDSLAVGTAEDSDDDPDLECSNTNRSKPTESFDFDFDVEDEENITFENSDSSSSSSSSEEESWANDEKVGESDEALFSKSKLIAHSIIPKEEINSPDVKSSDVEDFENVLPQCAQTAPFNGFLEKLVTRPPSQRKRSYSTIESSENLAGAEFPEAHTPKKARGRLIAREVRKGFIYVTATLVALVLYGGYLEQNGG